MAWVDDGSEAFTFEDDVAECTAPPATSLMKYNCAWKDGDGVSEGEHYWELDVIEGEGIWFGITNTASFLKGFRSRALTYCQNISDGSGLLVQSFGPKVTKTGDKIGMLVEFLEEKLIVRFYYNDRCLGAAFDIDGPTPTDLFPVVAMRKAGHKVKITKMDAPEMRERETAESNVGINGTWKIDDVAQFDNREFPMECLLTVTPQSEDTIVVNASIVNMLRTWVTKTEEGFKAGPINNTCRMGPPEKMEMENQMTEILGRLEDISVDGEDLVIKSAEGGNARFQPYVVPGPAAHTKNALKMGG